MSDLCMTVGFGLGLMAGGRMTKKNKKTVIDVEFAHENMSNKPPTGHPAVREVRSGAEPTLRTCPC